MSAVLVYSLHSKNKLNWQMIETFEGQRANSMSGRTSKISIIKMVSNMIFLWTHAHCAIVTLIGLVNPYIQADTWTHAKIYLCTKPPSSDQNSVHWLSLTWHSLVFAVFSEVYKCVVCMYLYLHYSNCASAKNQFCIKAVYVATTNSRKPHVQCNI